MLQQDLAMKAEALKQVDEFWMGWLGWWSESIREWMVNMVKQSTLKAFWIGDVGDTYRLSRKKFLCWK